MIKSNIKLFSFHLAMLVVVFVWLLKTFGSSDYQQSLMAETNSQNAVLSRISLLLAKSDTRSRHGLSHLLQEMDNLPSVIQWQLLDEKNKIIDSKNRLLNEQDELYQSTQNKLNKKQKAINILSQPFVFYIKNASGNLSTLKIVLATNLNKNTGVNAMDFLLIILLIVCILLLGIYHFQWLYQLESYACYIMSNNAQPKNNILKKTLNPISQAINHLILKNRLLQDEKVELTEQLRKMSFVDEATELGNHFFFKAEFEVRLHNHDESESGILMLLAFSGVETQPIDVKQNFEKKRALEDVNTLNDDILQAIANLLRHFIQDIPNALVARLRGNDFALLLPAQTREDTDKLCKNLIKQLDKAIFDTTNIKDNFVGIGLSAYKQGFDYYKVLAEADMALRNSQLQGENNWFMYGENLSANKVRGNLKWRSFLQSVLEQRKVQLYGQKIHHFNVKENNVEENKVEHIEIYVRIKDGNDILSADTFLPMANKCGLAVEFDRQVIDGLIKHCLYQPKDDVQRIYSVNLFISSLLDERFIAWLVSKLSSYPELCKQLYFEVGESHVVQNLDKVRPVFSQIAKLGVSWSIEKFGSIEQLDAFLELLPISRVKIDRRIINNIHVDQTQQLFLKTLMINLKNKQIAVFADGVEKEADACYLENAGLAGAQGYYFAKPERLKRVEGYLKAV